MKLSNATVLITGANRGIGLAFAKEALARGAHKVYAGVAVVGSVFGVLRGEPGFRAGAREERPRPRCGA